MAIETMIQKKLQGLYEEESRKNKAYQETVQAAAKYVNTLIGLATGMQIGKNDFLIVHRGVVLLWVKGYDYVELYLFGIPEDASVKNESDVQKIQEILNNLKRDDSAYGVAYSKGSYCYLHHSIPCLAGYQVNLDDVQKIQSWIVDEAADLLVQAHLNSKNEEM